MFIHIRFPFSKNPSSYLQHVPAVTAHLQVQLHLAAGERQVQVAEAKRKALAASHDGPQRGGLLAAVGLARLERYADGLVERYRNVVVPARALCPLPDPLTLPGCAKKQKKQKKTKKKKKKKKKKA